ncbi:MAG TPA: NlpC/P60 family protein [Acidimicrobiales bacterium]|nr:NlpC/P60 family protein [Acidimicrobiales bacterium]
MLRVRRRGATRTTPFLLVVALIASGTVMPSRVGALTIAQTQAEIANLSAALSQQEKTSEITSNKYDAEKAALAATIVNITNLQGREVQKHAAIVVTSKKLVTAVVRAYVLGAADAQILSLFNQNVVRSDATKVYQDQVIGNLNKLKNTYTRQKLSLQNTVAKVAVQRQKASSATYQLKALLDQNIRLENSTQATLTSVTKQLRSEIITYEIQAGVAAAKAKNTAGEEQAIAAASAVGGQDAANQVIDAIQAAIKTPTIIEVAGTAAGNKAVAAAKREIGVPYVWGGETPGRGFDCSGLVQWAWAQAGVTIPRTTETQYPVMHHVTLQDLQPGDLLFYYNLDGDHQIDHVVMYVGSGPWGVDTTIAAAHTGTDVALAPLFTAGLQGAARP